MSVQLTGAPPLIVPPRTLQPGMSTEMTFQTIKALCLQLQGYKFNAEKLEIFENGILVGVLGSGGSLGKLTMTDLQFESATLTKSLTSATETLITTKTGYGILSSVAVRVGVAVVGAGRFALRVVNRKSGVDLLSYSFEFYNGANTFLSTATNASTVLSGTGANIGDRILIPFNTEFREEISIYANVVTAFGAGSVDIACNLSYGSGI